MEPTSLESRSAGDLLTWGRQALQRCGADSPALTAMALLEHCASLRRETLIAHPERTLDRDTVGAFAHVIERRCAREPLAYIVGRREFYGRSFEVTPATLIPRPETEGLVELALARLDGAARGPVLDVGTGSGAIALTLLLERPGLRAVAVDVSLAALAVARRNANQLGVADRLQCAAMSLADGMRATFPLVVANLPYVPTAQLAELEPEVGRFEPRLALDGGPSGTDVIGALLDALPTLLAPKGLALLEIGDGEVALLRERFGRVPGQPQARFERDAAGIERFMVVERSA